MSSYRLLDLDLVYGLSFTVLPNQVANNLNAIWCWKKFKKLHRYPCGLHPQSQQIQAFFSPSPIPLLLFAVPSVHLPSPTSCSSLMSSTAKFRTSSSFVVLQLCLFIWSFIVLTLVGAFSVVPNFSCKMPTTYVFFGDFYIVYITIAFPDVCFYAGISSYYW